MAYNEYGEYIGETGEDLTSGYQMDDENYQDDSAGDSADAWLNAQNEVELVSSDERMGMATAADLQLGRIGHMEPRIQAGIKSALQGNFDGSKIGMDALEVKAAVNEFASVTGTSPSEFAERIKIPEGVNSPNARQDMRTVLSMLGNTAGEYLDKGAGSNLPGNTFDPDKKIKADEDLGQAFENISQLAELYIDPRTVGTSVYGARKQALTESITNRLMDGTFSDTSNAILALPNETGVTGIRPTRSIGGYLTTPYDRVSYNVALESGEVTDAEKFDFLPSAKNSLFYTSTSGMSDEQKANAKREKDFNYDQALEKARFARKVLRQQMPSVRDESKGQIRMAGWDQPYGDQAEYSDIRNEAAIQDKSWDNQYLTMSDYEGKKQASLDLEEYARGHVGKLDNNVSGGSDSGGMFNSGPNIGLSEVDLYAESTKEFTPTYNTGPAQGSAAWLAQRKGKITASAATGGFNGSVGLLGEGGVEEAAERLAMERLGYTSKFRGNAYTREGQEGEDIAKRAFLNTAGKDINFANAYFEENEDLPGFGVSPDGRLYDDENASQGLLELKYLASGSMKGALKKYTPQLQLQMAVTKEKQAHFFALDKFTGDYIHEIVEADPEMQRELVTRGQAAQAMAEGLDEKGVSNLRKEIKSSGSKKKSKAEDKKATAYEAHEEAMEEQTVFDEGAAHVHGVYPTGAGSAASTLLGEKLEKMDQAGRVKESITNALPENNIDPVAEKARQKAKGAFVNNQRGEFMGSPEDTGDDSMSDYYKEQQKAAADASKEASASLRNFSKAVGKAVDVLAELGGAVSGGNESGMDEVRLAAETGLDVANVRGMRKALERGGLSEGGIDRVTGRAGQLTKLFNDEQTSASAYTDIVSKRGRSNLKSVREMDVPSIQELQGMNPQQMTSMVAGMMEGKTPQERAQIGDMFGMTELASNTTGANEIGTARDENISEGGLRETMQGFLNISQAKRTVLEAAGSLGETVGTISGGAMVAGAIATSTTGAVIGAAALKTGAGQSAVAKASSLVSSAKGGAAAKLAKVGNLAKASPVAMAASLAPMAARALGGIEDDGGLADSGMDVLEMAAWGAAAGTMVPVVGTAIGAGVGAAIGVANEAYEYFAGDDALPSESIGNMPSPSQQASSNNKVTNVDVNVEVNPDLVRTTTSVDGDIDTDEESLDTGG